MSLAAGTKLGPCEILSPLGAGAMGEVYRGGIRGSSAPEANALQDWSKARILTFGKEPYWR